MLKREKGTRTGEPVHVRICHLFVFYITLITKGIIRYSSRYNSPEQGYTGILTRLLSPFIYPAISPL